MGHQIVIIGAGISGLAAARLLKQAGHDPLLLDKGRRIGGGCGTRRSEGYLFNHGAQFLTAASSDFSLFCRDAAAAGIVAEWDIGKRWTTYAGQPSMRNLPSWMAGGLDIHQMCEILNITRGRDGTVELITTTKKTLSADRLIITAPAPQTKRLLADISPHLSALAQEARYAPCWTVMAGFDEHLHSLPAFGADISDIISWYALEEARPGGTANRPAITIHASGIWSQTHLEEEADQIAETIFTEFASLTGLSAKPALLQAHRWRYAKVISPCIANHSRSEGIFIAGDWCPPETAQTDSGTPYIPTGSRAEDAFLSGIQAARALLGTP